MFSHIADAMLLRIKVFPNQYNDSPHAGSYEHTAQPIINQMSGKKLLELMEGSYYRYPLNYQSFGKITIVSPHRFLLHLHHS